MSTQTEHLGLHQWEAGDSFLRTDFNEDFAKIDAGVKAADAGVAAAKALAETLTANVCVTGTYTTTANKDRIDVQLGFRPKMILMFARTSYNLKLCFIMDGLGIAISYDTDMNTTHMYPLEGRITDQGFTIDKGADGINTASGMKVYYAALH